MSPFRFFFKPFLIKKKRETIHSAIKFWKKDPVEKKKRRIRDPDTPLFFSLTDSASQGKIKKIALHIFFTQIHIIHLTGCGSWIVPFFSFWPDPVLRKSIDKCESSPSVNLFFLVGCPKQELWIRLQNFKARNRKCGSG